MEKEYGHRVEVVEGFRTPERQAALYAQGRTRPGPVVTWTEASLHSQGKAADLQVDGSWDNPQAYERLRQIAEEEGLQTLGSRDAGHVQLPARDGDEAPGVRWDFGADGTGGRRMASHPARVARVAETPGPARVASVARPPQPGRGLPEPTGARGAPGPVQEAPARVRVPDLQPSGSMAELGIGEDGNAGYRAHRSPVRAEPDGRAVPTGAPNPSPVRQTRDFGAEERFGRDEDRGSSATAGDAARDATLFSQGWTQRSPAAAPEPRGVEALQRPGSAERVEEIKALEEALNARSPGRIHLELNDADGAGTRLRLSLRGSQLSGSVKLEDPAAALRMRDRVGELHEALTRQGLDARALGIQGQRGTGTAHRIDADLGALLQEPLAGLGRIMDSGRGGLDGRNHRQGDSGGASQHDAGPQRNPGRRDRNKEEGK